MCLLTHSFQNYRSPHGILMTDWHLSHRWWHYCTSVWLENNVGRMIIWWVKRRVTVHISGLLLFFSENIDISNQLTSLSLNYMYCLLQHQYRSIRYLRNRNRMRDWRFTPESTSQGCHFLHSFCTWPHWQHHRLMGPLENHAREKYDKSLPAESGSVRPTDGPLIALLGSLCSGPLLKRKWNV